jgi:DNA-binding transcriptional ArsR family regulator
MVRSMANQQTSLDGPQLDGIFRALADPTRRAVLERLGSGEAAVTELAAPFDMALPSFLQHLTALESAGLVRSSKHGRVRTYRITPAPLKVAEKWMVTQRALWERRLDGLDAYVRQMAASTSDRTNEARSTRSARPRAKPRTTKKVTR